MSKIRSVPNRVARPFLITLYRILITGVDKFQDWRGLLMNVELSLHDPFRNFYEAIRADNRTPKNCLLTHFPCLAWTPVRQKPQTPISWIRELKISELFFKKIYELSFTPLCSLCIIFKLELLTLIRFFRMLRFQAPNLFFKAEKPR